MLYSAIAVFLLAQSSSAYLDNTDPLLNNPAPFSGPPYSQLTIPGQAPNATKSINFAPFGPSVDATWTWTINITENAVPPSPILSSNARVLNTVYSFSWPQNGTNTSTMAGEIAALNRTSQYPVCVSAAGLRVLFPANVTNLFNDTKDASGDCTASLGSSCVNAIKNAWLTTRSNKTGCPVGNSNFNVFDASASGYFNISNIPECMGSVPAQAPIFSTMSLVNNNASQSLGNLNGTIRSGDAFEHWTTGYYNVTDPTYRIPFYDAQDFRVHMILVDGGVPDSFNALCMRVNTSVKATNDRTTGAESAAGVFLVNPWMVGLAGFVALAWAL